MHQLGRLFLHGGTDTPDQRLGDVLVMNLQTKADFTALMHKFLDPLKPYYSAGCARLHLGETGVTYNQNAIELEAFSRPLWALVPFWWVAAPTRNLKKSTARVFPPVPTRKALNTGHHRRVRPVLCGDGRHCLRHSYRTGKAVGTAF